MNFKGFSVKNSKKQKKKTNGENEKENKGITLIALVITIVLNCWRSGRDNVDNRLKYKKIILKNSVILENT